jgi:LPS O-antigen subunit length determinant protein (WzzB/FepE family)
MKKIHSIYSNSEIDLGELFKRLWNRKIKITLIALISFLIIISYHNYKPKKPNIFNNTLVINPTKEGEFLSFISIYNYINKSKSEENFIVRELKNTKVLDRFIEEFLDYDELISILKENDNIKKKTSQLSKYDQQQKLYEYAKLFKIEKSKTEIVNYALKFTWPTDDREIRDILDKALKLTEKNLRKSIFIELESYYKLEKNLITNKDLVRIEYLLEQSVIAKEQGIKEQSIIAEEKSLNIPLSLDDIKNKKNVIEGLTLNINSNNNTYSSDYLRGYEAIDLEINLIKKRKYIILENIREEIDLLKKKNITLVDYNIFLLDTKLQNKNKTLSLSFVILFSLIIGVVCTFIPDIFKFNKDARKK